MYICCASVGNSTHDFEVYEETENVDVLDD